MSNLKSKKETNLTKTIKILTLNDPKPLEMTESNAAFLRFLPPLEIFQREDNTNVADQWLKSATKLKTVAGMSDSIILTIATSNMSKKARTWWSSVEESVKTWKEFKEKFTNRFMKNKVIEACEQIKQIRQREIEMLEI